MKKKCQIVKASKHGVGSCVVYAEVVLDCKTHNVYFGSDAKKKRPKSCPITRI